ncbi:MAG: hypothetical protein RMJ14_01895 [Nitrososphaerota archaeon]|nr:hypothetical protein [Aigarchaeota archaeon]MDW8076375.1 hypothetical protein [Nitrososphaerota archaeon]
MAEYEDLVKRILRRRPELSEEELEKKIEEKLRSSPMLSKLGALLLLADELGVLETSEYSTRPFDVSEFTKISSLVSGLNDVSLYVRIIAVSPLVMLNGKAVLRMKVGDETGKASTVAWEQKAEELASVGLSPGMVVVILHAYTRSGPDGKPEIHIGRNTSINIVEDTGILPRVESFFIPASKASTTETFDIRGTLVMVSELRSIQTNSGTVNMVEALLADEYGETVLVAWRDKVELITSSTPGTELMLTDVKFRGGQLQTTARTCIAKTTKSKLDLSRLMTESKKLMNNKILRVLDVIEQQERVTLIVSDGVWIYRLPSSSLVGVKIREGDAVRVVKGFVSERNGRKIISTSEYGIVATTDEDARKVPMVDRRRSLTEINGEESDIIVEGILHTKTPLGLVETKFGKAEKISFWLRDGETTVLCSAWRSKAKEIDSIPIGKRVQLRWVRVRRNVFGELEISAERDTKVVVLET